MKATWPIQSRSNLLFLPGALTDFWGRTNDTIRHSIIVNNPDQFGDMTITVDGLDSTLNYILQIKTAENVLMTFPIENVSFKQLKATGISPGKYTIEVIEDTNRNGKWDTGSFERRIAPEKKMIFEPENLRSGWELDTKITWKQLSN